METHFKSKKYFNNFIKTKEDGTVDDSKLKEFFGDHPEACEYLVLMWQQFNELESHCKNLSEVVLELTKDIPVVESKQQFDEIVERNKR